MSTNRASMDQPRDQQDESMGIEQLPQTELESNPATGQESEMNSGEAFQNKRADLFQTPDPAQLQVDAKTTPLEERVASIGGAEAVRKTSISGEGEPLADETNDRAGHTGIESAFVQGGTD